LELPQSKLAATPSDGTEQARKRLTTATQRLLATVRILHIDVS